MKAKIIAIGMACLMLAMATSAMAKPYPQADNGLNKGPVTHLYLFEKDPTDWTIVEDGAWGKLTYKNMGFVFNGHELEPDWEYALIYYADPWEDHIALKIGTGTADEYGDVHIMGEFDFSSIPYHGDINDGAKIWLVVNSHLTQYTCDEHGLTYYKFNSWDATEYLFEYALINPTD